MEAIHPQTGAPDRNRFTIADLLWLTFAVVGSIAFIQSMFPLVDYDTPELVFATVLTSIIFAFSFVFMAVDRFWLRIICLLLLYCLTVFIDLNAPHVRAWLGLGIGLLIALMLFKPSRSVRLGLLTCWLFLSMIAGTILAEFFPPPRLSILLEARMASPIEDISVRLSKLNTPRFHSAIPAASDPPAENSPGAQDWSTFYELDNAPLRIKKLEMVHDAKYERFIRSLGFGERRMSQVSINSVALPPITSIALDGKGYEVSRKDRPLTSNIDELRPVYVPMSLEDLLKRSYIDFLNPATFGWMPEPKKIAGFEPHSFRFPIPKPFIRSKSYKINRLELIGLLLKDEPRVYVSDFLPRMDQLSDAETPTRELNEFEATALEKNVAGENLVVHERSDRIEMMGALRAFENCAQCHDSKVGDLLGAFSYELEPID